MGRPSKKERTNATARCPTLPLRAEVGGACVAMNLKLEPEYPLFEPPPESGSRNPYRVRSVKSKSKQKKEAFKRRFPREMPAQPNPPRYYSTDRERQKREEGHYTGFVTQYRERLDAFRAGDRDVVFPAGTVKMRQIAGVKCARAP
jgi:hypothetical protein